MSCVYLSQAQIVTDRPDATESAVTVPEGRVQIESGSAYEEYGDITGNSRIGIPMGLLRYGFNEDFEIRFASDFQLFSNPVFEKSITYLPIQLGFKFSLFKENGIVPDLAFLSHYSIEYSDLIGTYSFSEKTEPKLEFEKAGNYLDQSFDIRIAFAYTLPFNLSFGGNLGTVVWTKPDDENKDIMMKTDARYFDLYQWTANLEYSALDNLAFYSELFGDFNSDEARTDLNVGIKFLATQNMQLDAFYIKVLSLPDSEIMNDDYYQFGFGFSYLWN